ncbi:MAG: hypothetical protein AAFQ82_16745 [Myxococcota bacterium]
MTVRRPWGFFFLFGLPLLALVVSAVGTAYFEVCEFFRVDACLNDGGCWDYQRAQCEYEDQLRCTPDSRSVGETANSMLQRG